MQVAQSKLINGGLRERICFIYYEDDVLARLMHRGAGNLTSIMPLFFVNSERLLQSEHLFNLSAACRFFLENGSYLD